MDIVEEASGFKVPDFRTFVTDNLIAHLMTSDLWTPHGSELSVWWEEGALDYWNGEDEGLAGLDWEEAKRQDHAAVGRILHNFLIARAGWIQRTFTSGDRRAGPSAISCRRRRSARPC